MYIAILAIKNFYARIRIRAITRFHMVLMKPFTQDLFVNKILIMNISKFFHLCGQLVQVSEE